MFIMYPVASASPYTYLHLACRLVCVLSSGCGVTVSGTIKRYGVHASAVPATVACVSVFMARFTAGAGRTVADATSYHA